MKTRPPSQLRPLDHSGRRVSRQQRSPPPTRWNRIFRSRLERGTLDDFVRGILDLSIARRERRLVIPQITAPSPCGPESNTKPDTKGASSGEGTEHNATVTVPAPALTSSVNTQANPIDDLQVPNPFRNPVEIPLAAGIFVYPHSASAIDGAFQDRFREIQNYFRRNAEVHVELKAHVEHIEYVLKMCGPSVEDAHPSIIVFCRPSEFKALKSLLNEKHLKRQWCRRKSSPSYLFWRNKKKGGTASNLDGSDHKPLFNLYFWRTSQPRNIFCLESRLVQLESGSTNPFTLSGAVISVPHPDNLGVSYSTIACTLQVDQSFYALTAAHVLHRVANPSKYQLKECSQGQAFRATTDRGSVVTTETVESNDDDSDGDDFVPDIAYCDDPEDGVFNSDAPMEPFPKSTMRHEDTLMIDHTAVTKALTCAKILKDPDLDWAVVQLDSQDLLRPNALDSSLDIKNGSQVTYFSKIIPKLPKKETPVLIQTSHGVRRALLQPAAAFLGGINYHTCPEPVLYWTLILSDGESLSYGDSGSIVIDAASHGVYGHVVASNPIGEVYVSPMASTVRQIRDNLDAKEVVLPDPLAALTKLTCHYLREEKDDAFRLLAELDELTKPPVRRHTSRKNANQLRCWERSADRQSLSVLVNICLSPGSLRSDLEPQRWHLLQKFMLGTHSALSGVIESTSLEDPVPTAHNVDLCNTTCDSICTFRIENDDNGDMKTLPTHQLVLVTDVATSSASSSRTAEQLQPEEGGFEVNVPTAIQHAISAQKSPKKSRCRRSSMDEDMFYQQLLTSRPETPPSYENTMRQKRSGKPSATAQINLGINGVEIHNDNGQPPRYACDIHLEGVFMRKVEIQEVCKGAEDKTWRMVYAELRGTLLIIYNVKKDRGWWKAKGKERDLSPDQPPWVNKGAVEKAYSLLHGDVGIAADYRKRRYVIRLRLEDDQFLLSCVELSTFVDWLDLLFAAINVAAPIDERDFPRDQNIPRIQRIRWLRRTSPELEALELMRPQHIEQERDEDGGLQVAEETGEESLEGQGVRKAGPTTNESLDSETGKWAPRHNWTAVHDQLYAKLCYGVLLFKSPRKSNYVICKGDRWYVDWATGRMVRVLPPRYAEAELFGPWQVTRTADRFK